MTSNETIMSDYKEIFEGVGKLEDYQVKLHVNPDVPRWRNQSGAPHLVFETKLRRRLKN